MIMPKLEHDLRHYHSFRPLSDFGFLNPRTHQGNFQRKRMCATDEFFLHNRAPGRFYRHNPSDFGQFCQNPKHPVSHYATGP
jgi:hypothetical protein